MEQKVGLLVVAQIRKKIQIIGLIHQKKLHVIKMAVKINGH